MFSKVLRFFSNNVFSKDYYKILSVDTLASKSDIRAAYLKLAKQYHPDSPTGNEEKFKELGEAWSVLGNEKNKEEYDMWKKSGGSSSKNWDAWNNNPFDNTQYKNYNEFDYTQWQQQSRNRSKYTSGSPFNENWERFFKEDQQANKNKSTKTEYYEYYNPRTGRRVFYSFKTAYKPKNQSENKDEKIFQEFFNDFSKQNKRNWNDDDKKAGLFDLIAGGMFFFSLILSLAIFIKLMRWFTHENTYNPYDPYDSYYNRNPNPREHVWDEFAREMHQKNTRDKK